MEKMKEKVDQEKVQKLQEMKRKGDEGTIAALKYARSLEKDAAHRYIIQSINQSVKQAINNLFHHLHLLHNYA